MKSKRTFEEAQKLLNQWNEEEHDGAQIARELADYYEQQSPELWRKCYPRIIQGAGGYESPRFVAVNLFSSIQWTDIGRSSASLTAMHVAMSASQAFEFGLPSFFITREFLAAISNTELPNIRWTDAKLPFEAGLLYLPLGALRDPEGAAVNVIGWCRQHKGEMILVGEKTKIDCVDDAFVVFGLCDPSTERIYSHGVNAMRTPYITGPVIPLEENKRGILDLPLTKDDEEFLKQMVSICFSVLLAQTSTPALVTMGERTVKREKKSKKGRRVFWTPTFIGLNYKIKREHQGGTHASPRCLRRRGHWTHQPIGDFRGNDDFVSAATLPRFLDGRINWDAVVEEKRKAFWRHHEPRWIEPIWNDYESQPA